MSVLLELSTQLQGLSAAIATHERALVDSPSPSLIASLASLKKRMVRLEADFAAIAAGRGVDVCRYRFVTELSKATVPPICNALLKFQDAYTLAFDAIKNGRKQIARISSDIVAQTLFGVGYSFAGSLGIVLTFQNDRVQLFGNEMDDAMGAVLGVMRSDSPQQVEELGRLLGAPPIRAIYQWAKVHVESDIGVDIAWVHGDDCKSRMTMEVRQLSNLVDILNRTNEEYVEQITKTGMLAGGEHMTRHQFHFIADDGTDIKGTYQDAISPERPVKWPMRYEATIKKTVKVFYTTDTQESASYLLLHLDELPD